ncbi:MAG: ankyrin repeat domain-containing protein [Cephaloticoccus sp.]|nr:ankyrin repeat domain-containing protein [Cephaloticoccus sp.]MCF7759964.1 ankyrin repeat domain-containing protein [Cephaloticoccus sp.]
MKKQLPERPDLEQLKKQAKDLLNEMESRRPEALARIGEENQETFALHDAQRILAREYGFESWPKLKLHVETRTEDTAEARLIEAALSGDMESIRIIVAERPGIWKRSLYAAAALGATAAVEDWLAREPDLVAKKGGPRNWEPIIYVCFGRCDGGDETRATLAQRLLALGADPNTHWIHETWPDSPQPLLYGATGVNNYPRLARVLLEAGADPNDCESRYHAAEANHLESLAVLFEAGTDFSGPGKPWGNTPLYFLLGWYKPAPAVKDGIRWLLEHGVDPNVPSYVNTLNETPLLLAVRNSWEIEIIALLLKHGADPCARRSDGRTAYALAVQGGRDDVAALLLAQGAPEETGPVDRFLGACMRGDEAAARAVLAAQPGLVGRLTTDERLIVHEAAKRELPEAIALMARLGMDIAAVSELEHHGGETALHLAAWHGQVKAVAVLLQAGAPLHVHDKRFDAPPIGWCEHGSLYCKNPEGDYVAVAELLYVAGARLPEGVVASPEVMAVVRRHRAKEKLYRNQSEIVS